MGDAAAPAAPTQTASDAAETQATLAPERRAGEKPFRFTLEKGADFSLDAMLKNGYVQAIIRISAALAVSFRTMTVSQLQDIEALANPREDSKTMKYVMNNMTIGQVYFSIVAINGVRCNPAPEQFDLRMTDKDPRWKQIREFPGPLFDQITAALIEFDRHAKALVSPENLRNF